MPSPKLVPLFLSDAEHKALEVLVRKRTVSQSLAMRARIVLACAEDSGTASLTVVAEKLGVSRESVRKWRVRFMEERIEGLTDAPRPGAPRKFSDDQVEAVVTRVLAVKGGEQGTIWSTRSMAAEAGMSQSSVSRIWRAFGFKPYGVETWRLSTDQEFIAKVRGVAGLYMNPPEHALVLAVGEKCRVPAMECAVSGPSAQPTAPTRVTRLYARNTSDSLFAAYDVSGGSMIAQSCPRRRNQEFLRFLKVIDADVPKDLDLHLIMDDDVDRKTPAIDQWLVKHPRFRLHLTPASSTWFRLAERWFTELTSDAPQRPADHSVVELEAQLRKWIAELGSNPGPFVWTKPAEDILI